MRKVRLLVLPGALLVKVSLSLGDTGSGSAHRTKKKILINSKKRSQNTYKRVGLYST